MAKRAMDCMRVSCSKYMGLSRSEKLRTHWSHQLPNRWELCAWFVAVTCATWCSVAKQAGPWFWWNVSCCIWCILAHKAEQRKLPKQGTIRRARFVGARRVTRRWKLTNRQAWCRRGGRVALLLMLFVVGRHVNPQVFSTYIPVKSAQMAWAISRKKRNRQMHARNGNPTYQPKKRKVDRERVDVGSSQQALQHGVAAASQREQRVQDNIIQIPGDGWCFFHAVGRYCTRATTWSTSHAAEIYLQALEWLLDARSGPRADEVLIACTPESDAELNKHRTFISARSPGVDTTAWTDTDVVLWSKLLAILEKPCMLDSIHHGSAVEIWALTQAFGFDCLVWSSNVNENHWIRTMQQMTDMASASKLQETSNVLELVHRDTGVVTGHYDLVQRAQHAGRPFPVTPLLQQWRTEGAESVRRFVRATFLRAAPTAATTGTEAKQCSRSKMPSPSPARSPQGQPTQVRTMSSSASPSIFVPRRRKVAQTDRIADVGGAAQGHRVAEACPAQQTYHTATDAARVGPDRVADTAAAPVDRVADIDRVADDTGNAATTDPLRSQFSSTPNIFVPRRRKGAQTDRIADAGEAAQGHRVAGACPAQQTYHMVTPAATVGPDRVADTTAAPVDRV